MQKLAMTEEEELKEWTDTALDPIYFIDEYCKAYDITKDKVDNIKCFEYQRRVIGKFIDERWNIILKSRQCLPAGTRVNTPLGVKSVEDFKKGDKLYSYNLKKEEKEEDVVYEAWNSGEKECVKFKLNDSRSFVVGKEHPFYVEEKGWVQAQNLKQGDKIKSVLPKFGNKKPKNIELLCLLSDGFGKEIPSEVFHWNKKNVALLLESFFSQRGKIDIKKDYASIYLESSSENFLYQVKDLLLRFKIFSNIHQEKKTEWKLIISHSESCKIFIQEIKCYKECLEEINSFNNLEDYDSVVVSVKKDVKQVCYDISVDKNENFFVDGLLTHNTGISVITACYVAWRLIFGVDETIVIIANNQDGAARFLKHVKNVLIQLPSFLYDKARDEVSFATMKVELSNGNQAIAKAAGKNAGRGDSPTLLVLDEWAFAADDEDIWTAAGASLSQTEGDCIVISTPNGTGNQFHKMWVDAGKPNGSFNPIRVHWTENPKSSVGLEYREDKDGNKKPWSPWYEERCKEYQYDGVKIAQELDLSFSGSKLLALDPAEIARQRNRILLEKIQPKVYFDIDVKSQNPLVGYETSCHIYEIPSPEENYIIACDVAYRGTDYSTIQVINVKTLNQAAEYQGKIDPDVFAYIIAKIGKWYNNAFVIVEANNHGLVTGFELRNKIKYPNLYHSISSHPKAIHVRQIDYVVNLGDGIPGFMTTATSRPGVVNAIRESMRENDVKINSSRLIGEMEVFIRNVKKNGKEEAEAGYNDDLVLAFGIALYILSTEYYNQNMAKSRAKAMLEAINFNQNEYEGNTETPEEKIRRLKEEEKFDNDFIPPGAGGLWINRPDENSDEDDFNDSSWLLA